MIRLCLIAAVATAALLTGCQELRVPGVYRIDIQQGNVITQEQLAALERGMEKRKVRFLVGEGVGQALEVALVTGLRLVQRLTEGRSLRPQRLQVRGRDCEHQRARRL